MAIDKEILSVARPKNTIVCDNKSSGPKRYAVRVRIGSKYVHGRNPMPINGPIIGHILNGKYVPLTPKATNNGPDMLSYGSSALVKSVSSDILDDLLKVYSISDSYSIMAAASLKVIKPGISSKRMADRYNQTFLSVYYPVAELSENSLTSLYTRIGQDTDKMKSFYQLRFQKVSEPHHVIIGATLKQGISKVNDLSEFSYKPLVKGVEDISILFAFDYEDMIPIASGVIPGNSIDSVSYHEFVENSGITRGIIIDDEEFAITKIKDILQNNPRLHYLTPLKHSDRPVEKYHMLDFDNDVNNIKETVLCKKVKINDKKFLYSFQDSRKEYNEKKTYIENAAKSKNLSSDKYASKQESFGVIVFESDVDLTSEQALLVYQKRWLLEVAFKRYKSDTGLYTTKVQSDYAVIGAEFVNFISTITTCRIVNKATKLKLFEDMTYEELMDDLSEAWRKVSRGGDEESTPRSSDNNWVHTIGKVKDLLELLGLSKPTLVNIPEKKKPGRPKKNKTEEDSDNPKRPVGRPRKQKQDSASETPAHGKDNTKDNTDKPKRPVGRPRKQKEDS